MSLSKKIIIGIATVVATITGIKLIGSIIKKKSDETDEIIGCNECADCDYAACQCGEFSDIQIDDYVGEENDNE